MITVIITDAPLLRDSIVQDLWLQKDPMSSEKITIYRRREWILLFASHSVEHISYAVENYLPEHIFLPVFGKSLSPEHRIGDVVVPNVFFSYNPAIETTLITRENRDALVGSALFLEDYEKQGDFLLKDYGFSIGGILLEWVRTDIEDELSTKIGMVYESDVLIPDEVTPLVEAIRTLDLDATFLVGVTDGKLTDIPHGMTKEHFTTKNLIETMKWIKEERA